MNKISVKPGLPILLVAALLSACGAQEEKKQTLADIDLESNDLSAITQSQKSADSKERSAEEVKQAYYEYIKDADASDKLRAQAVRRIAELELSATQNDSGDELLTEEALYEQNVRKTITLLEGALRDFPDAPGTEHNLYQLAKAYDQIGESEKAIDTLEELVQKYPASPYFVEAKFRIAESAFVRGLYLKSEVAYTDVISNTTNDVFLEKAYFKRGWTRFKQEIYTEGLEDYYAAVDLHGFTEEEPENKAEKELYDEYFRAIGLSFIYMGGAPALSQYFAERPKSPNQYRTYSIVADLLVLQERFNDAVTVLKTYVQNQPYGDGVVQADLAAVNIWKDYQFFNAYVAAVEDFYQRYEPGSDFWNKVPKAQKERQFQQANEALRLQMVRLSGYYHNQYLKRKNDKHYEQAYTWYQRYLSVFSAYARQDKIYPLFAELLNTRGELDEAFKYYELAAFDGDIVLDKESAYAAIYLSDKLYRQASADKKALWLTKHLTYAQQYGELYPGEARSADLVLNAVQLAFKDQRYEQTVALANLTPDSADPKTQKEISLLRAQAYFDLKNYEDAEVMYRDLLANQSIKGKELSLTRDRLALSMYRQGERARDENNTDEAARQFLRVYSETPDSELAATALYDTTALFMAAERWDQAIEYLNVFKKEYPGHQFQSDVSKKLSVAYLKADRSIEAAKEFESLTDFASNEEEKMAAQWQAAELYYKKGNLNSALRAYKEYAHTYKQPYAQNVEAMNYLNEIYQKLGDREKRFFWLRKIAEADKRAPKSTKTERTQYLAARAAFDMALIRTEDFKNIRLVIPLAQSLKNKKTAMQDAVKLYGQAAVYGHKEFVTQSAYQIGEIYRIFARDMLDSERPNNLNADELDQYNILLEDQAFPFEDKSIEFHEANIDRIAEGNYDEWVKASLTQLSVLFPARYGREGKVEIYFEAL